MIRLLASLSACTAVMFLVVLTQCNPGPTGPAGPQLQGTMSGFAILVNANGALPANRDSVKVTVDSTQLQTITDSTGKWSFSGVMTGTYNLTFSRTNYPTTRLLQVQFTGGAPDSAKDVGTVYLCQAPNFSVKTLSQLNPVRSDSATIHLAVQLTDSTVTGPYMPYRVFLFLGTDSSVSFDPAHYQSVLTFTMLFQKGLDSTTIKLTPATFAANGYAAGSQVFIAAYAANAGTNNSSYLDLATGRVTYTNLNATRSNIVQVLVASDTIGPAGIGSMSGTVALVEANGAQPPNLNGVNVSIDGTSFGTSTDATGAWAIQNLGPGTYNITFVKPGYDSAHVVQVVSTGAGSKSIGTTDLCQAPSFSVAKLWHWTSQDTDRIRLGVKLTDTTVSDSNVPYRVFLFFGTDSTVSSNPSTYRSVSVNNVMAFQNGIDSTSIILTAASASLINYDFIEGSSVYIAAYTANAGTINSSYTDPVTGRVIYDNINTMKSNVVKVVVP